MLRYQVGAWLAPEDVATFVVVIQGRHPAPADVIGSGVVAIGVVQNEYGRKGPTIVRADGSAAECSQRALVTKRWRTLDEYIAIACRNAVEDQTRAFRDAAAPVCALCGASADHVDHAPPWTFVAMWQAWAVPIRTHVRQTDFSQGSHASPRWADPRVTASFATYHRMHAVLRMLCAACNLSTTRRK